MKMMDTGRERNSKTIDRRENRPGWKDTINGMNNTNKETVSQAIKNATPNETYVET